MLESSLEKRVKLIAKTLELEEQKAQLDCLKIKDIERKLRVYCKIKKLGINLSKVFKKDKQL